MLYFNMLIMMNTLLGAFKYTLKGTNGMAALTAMAILTCVVLLMCTGFACLVCVLISGSLDNMSMAEPIICTAFITIFEWLADGKEKKE